MKLVRHAVEKPWGRTDLSDGGGRRIGEIWFEAPDGRNLPLLVKHIFTSEKLSVQVHPNDAQARARGLPNGKSECWFILRAEPGAVLGLGFKEPIRKEEMRQAALDGSIEKLMDWKPVRAGDFFYVPAGTVHAIGADLSLIEVQQQSDTTYRLYDYGRPRELHLDDGVDVAEGGSYPEGCASHIENGERGVLVKGPHFTLLYVGDGKTDKLADRQRWAIPISGTVTCDGEQAAPGECLLIEPGRGISGDGPFLLAANGPQASH
ncbi:MAG TPA: class I mannose-6-phosphate isomerase [Allosphingosinicella sp.]|jgi:mannose-6-phosphate isomerase|nr:class I mannose-6-phosphate isomerase [Allosphingosinicella sp.]